MTTTTCPTCGKSVIRNRDGELRRHWSNGIRCYPDNDAELAYDGGWMRDGLILRPARQWRRSE